jgi:hypothetical protein
VSKEKLSVKGLANIGQFMSRVPTANVDPTPPKDSKEAIIAKTVNAMPLGAAVHRTDVERVVAAAVREAFNLGHAAALAQNDMVEQLLNKQYEARTALTLPAAVAAIMEQTGQDELILDLTAVATVFDRVKLDMAVNPVDEKGDLVEYKLTHFADGAGDASFALAP